MPDASGIVPDPGNGAVLYGKTTYRLWRSETAGESWENLPSPGGLIDGLAVAKATGVVYLQTTTGTFKSTDRGSSWLAMTGLTGALLAVDSSNPPRIYMSTTSGVRRTADEGVSFESLPLAPIALDPSDPRTLYALTHDEQFTRTNLVKSVDDGHTYETILFGPYTTFMPSRCQVHPTSSNTRGVRQWRIRPCQYRRAQI
jgi:hypothetical protein